MKKTQTDFEILLRRAMVEGDTVAPPPLEESWARLEAKLVQRGLLKPARPHRAFRRYIVIAAAFVLFSLVVSSLVFPERVTALGSRVLQIHKWFGEGTTVNVTRNYTREEVGNPPPPPTDKAGKAAEDSYELTVDEARQKFPFFTPPRHTVPGFKLIQVHVQEAGQGFASISMRYEEPNGRYYLVSQRNIGDDGYAEGVTFDYEDGVMKNIKVGDHDAMLVKVSTKYVLLCWDSSTVSYKISGNLSPEEAIRVGESITP